MYINLLYILEKFWISGSKSLYMYKSLENTWHLKSLEFWEMGQSNSNWSNFRKEECLDYVTTYLLERDIYNQII